MDINRLGSHDYLPQARKVSNLHAITCHPSPANNAKWLHSRDQLPQTRKSINLRTMPALWSPLPSNPQRSPKVYLHSRPLASSSHILASYKCSCCIQRSVYLAVVEKENLSLSLFWTSHSTSFFFITSVIE